MRTESRGWLRLASDDPLAAPRMCLNGLQAEADRRVFRESVRMTREIAAQAAFDRVRGPEVAPGPDVTSDADIDAFVRANANSAYHLCGTCRIGTDGMAVVDPELRVRGIDGLRVADASVMPSITNGNTNAPSLMIGEKAAQMIRGNRVGRGGGMTIRTGFDMYLAPPSAPAFAAMAETMRRAVTALGWDGDLWRLACRTGLRHHAGDRAGGAISAICRHHASTRTGCRPGITIR